jgi:pilus assembly protein Flp/PilA
MSAMKILLSRFVADPLLMQFIDDTSGATAIEYGLIAAGISVAIIAVVQGLGTKLTSTFTAVQNALN